MRKTKRSHKIIAVFLTLNFLTTIIPVNQLLASNNGPTAPEAAGFEPVDATDMVNLSTGDLSYVLPLMSVEGFPVNLSYHAGMTTDLDASWVGLGWYLNPGAINRSVTNTPDDWKSGVGINFNSFKDEVDYFGISVDLGFPSGGSVGVGLNWGGGQGLSGSVSASLHSFKLGDMVNVGPNAGISATSSGDVTGSVGVGAKFGSMGAGASISYSLKNQWGISGGAGVQVANNSYLGIGMSSSGGFGVGMSAGTTKSGVSGSAGVGMSSNSFSSGDANVDAQSTGVALPLHAIGIPLTLGFSRTKIKINIRKGYTDYKWGALYASDYNNYANNEALIYDVNNYNELFNDYVVRTNSMDTYSTRIPQLEEEFIGDYSKDIENINFTYMGYDDYNVAAQGLMGNMTPRVFQNATIFDKGQRTKNGDDDDIHIFWHYGQSNNAVQRDLGSSNTSGDMYFYFDGQFTSRETNDALGLISGNISTANDVNDLINEGTHNTSFNNAYGRAKSPNYVEVFTNKQIASGYAKAQGLISPATVPDTHRDDIDKFDPDGIGAYKVTAPDGKTYHFALPVYHFEQIHRGQINKQEDNNFNIANVYEKRQYSRYATHWLLTAITGSDYIDINNDNQFNKEDYGYWVELEYGKWSDGFVWRSPYKDKIYNYNTNVKKEIGSQDKGSYSFGRKQIYYLDKINTRNRTALFVKDMRYDAIGKNLKFQYSNVTTESNPFGGNLNIPGGNYIGNTGDGDNPNSLKFTNGGIYVKEYKVRNDGTGRKGVEYDREYSLRLSKIVLVDGDVGKNLPKNISGNLGVSYSGYVPNSTGIPNWESDDFEDVYGVNYSYSIHSENSVLDINDVNAGFISQNALKVIELDHTYDLAKNSDSSGDAPSSKNPNKGKLTLRSVQVKGKGGADYMPATHFDYYLEDMDNISLTTHPNNTPTASEIQDYIEAKELLVDPWGFLQGEYTDNQGVTHNKIKAWSLKKITMPTGAEIEVDYEEDDYWIEAFSRRYWEEALMFKFTKVADKLRIEIQNETNNLTEDVDFTKYFNSNGTAFIDLWACGTHDYNNWGCQRRRGKVDIKEEALDIISVTTNNVILECDFNSNVIESNGNPLLNKWIGIDYHPGFILSSQIRGECSNPPGCINVTDRLNLKYKLLANKVPENETGGGLRVSELRTIDNGVTYKVDYDYTHPTENRSSGITSYAPVDGLKFVPYQSEVPGPGVMYEYVTMKETSNTGDYYSKTRYRHHVLKPVLNIFNPNIEMEALDANATGEDNIFWANVTEDYGGFDGTNSKKIEAKKIDIHVNTALIGQVKSIENINNQGHVMMKTENEYVNGTILNGQEYNKGYVKESFNSMKTVFETNDSGTVVQDEKRLLSVSSKTVYNNMLKKTTTITSGQKASVEYFEVDPWLSSFRKSRTTMADGTITEEVRVPAYEKYPDMHSKVLSPSNKNMLTQQVMGVTSYNNGYNLRTLNASITTWNDDWTYRDNLGNEVNESGVWRQHKTFAWKEAVDANGAYLTNINENNDYFNWSTGTPTSNNWQNVSEITRYTHWSSPVESKDINNNFTASKMADDFSKVTASGNARYTEIYYSGAEYVETGNRFEGEVQGANFRTNDVSHTGDYAVKNNAANDQVFAIYNYVGADHNDLSKDFRPGKYKVSFWVHNQENVDVGTKLRLHGNDVPVSETVIAGCWKQFNYYITLQPNSSFGLHVTNDIGGGFYFDDFRMHPVSTSMNSFVYDQSTNELLYALDANNMATAYRYDVAGRLKTTYREVEDTPAFSGGFKIVSQYKYNYKEGNNAAITYNENIDNCLNQDYKPLASKGLSITCTPEYNAYDKELTMYAVEGSGNYQYEWRWLTDTNNNTFSNWVEGGQSQFVPYAVKYCSSTTFDKVWQVEARVTDLVTNEVVTATLSSETQDCLGFIADPRILLGVEASDCHGVCADSKYKFHLYPLDPNITVPRPTGYIDNNSGQSYTLDIYESDGLFCPDIKYVETSNCSSGYIEFVSITTTHTNMSNPTGSPYTMTYEFYLDCASDSDVDAYPQLKNGKANDPKYAQPGTMVTKDEDGKILSVINIANIKR